MTANRREVMKKLFEGSLYEFRQKVLSLIGDISKGLNHLYGIDSITIKEELESPKRSISRYELTGFPGCCGLVVSHGAWVLDQLRGQGKGQALHQERLKLSKELGYSAIAATTISANKKEIHILEKNGWKKIHEFKNSRTGNQVQMWIKDLN